MKTLSVITALFWASVLPLNAQRSVMDDDIYYSPKKDKKSNEQVVAEAEQIIEKQNNEVSYDTYSSADFDIDVDAYNRRYTTEYPDTTATKSQTPENVVNVNNNQTYYVNGVGTSSLEYTERIKRFHNPEVGLYIADNEYNTIYLIEDDYTPYVSSVNIIASPWITPWSWSYSWYRYPYYNSWYWNNYLYYDPWYWPSAYYPGYYPPRPYPGYRPTPPPPPHKPNNPQHGPDYRGGNHGTRYTPGGSVGTGGRTDGTISSRPSNRPNSVSPNRNNPPKNNSRGTVGGRGNSNSSNRGTSSSGGSFSRPSYSSPSTQSYSPGNYGGSSGGSRGGTGSRVQSSSGRRVGGR